MENEITIYKPGSEVILLGSGENDSSSIKAKVMKAEITEHEVFYEVGYWDNWNHTRLWLPASFMRPVNEGLIRKIGFR